MSNKVSDLSLATLGNIEGQVSKDNVEKKEKEREWSNPIEFLMTCIGIFAFKCHLC